MATSRPTCAADREGPEAQPADVATAIVDALKVNPAASGLIDSAEVADGLHQPAHRAGGQARVVRQALRERDCSERHRNTPGTA